MLDTDKTLNGLMGYKNEVDDDPNLALIIEKLIHTDAEDIPDDAQIEAWIDENGEAHVTVTPMEGTEG